MKQAVIQIGSKQHIVAPDQVLDVDLIKTQDNGGTLEFQPLMVFDGESIEVGTPLLTAPLVKAKLLENVKDNKVISIRYKAKKRVSKRHGHRQRYARIQITSIG
jgi:large subunit ribosomal protein L21